MTTKQPQQKPPGQAPQAPPPPPPKKRSHTPGRWAVDPSAFPDIRAFDEHSNTCCLVAGVYAANREADAHLIAAAPDLLEACKAALNTPSYWPECGDGCNDDGEMYHLHAQLKAAVKKAEGHDD